MKVRIILSPSSVSAMSTERKPCGGISSAWTQLTACASTSAGRPVPGDDDARALIKLAVNRLQSLTPPFSDNSTSCRADRRSDPTHPTQESHGSWFDAPFQEWIDDYHQNTIEPLRVDRRLFRLSHAAMAGSFSMA
jgi:hypothetical protein